MSNNSAVAISVVGGESVAGEIGRAQAMQAAACGLSPDVRFNPVLLKPGSDLTSQVVLRGRAIGTVDAARFDDMRSRLAGAALESLVELRSEYDVVICEGAGSPAEINLRAHDFVNLGLARGQSAVHRRRRHRRGALASLFGTWRPDPADRALVAGFVINRFRGSSELLAPGSGCRGDDRGTAYACCSVVS